MLVVGLQVIVDFDAISEVSNQPDIGLELLDGILGLP